LSLSFFSFLYCRYVAIKSNGNASVDALAQDHINDVMINIIGGVPAIVAGYIPRVWFLDPIGAIVLSLYIAVRWIKTCYDQFGSLIGESAPPFFIRQLVFLAAQHHPAIIKVDTVYAYYLGSQLQCEVHIVLPEDMPLRIAHDIGESLEKKIEMVPDVEMAFVHLDYECLHSPEHKPRIKQASS